MNDRYTKAVLTVIAAALVVIVAQNTLSPARAQFGDGCGSAYNPCYVEYRGMGLDVWVTNWP